jgi:hypothetical protein
MVRPFLTYTLDKYEWSASDPVYLILRQRVHHTLQIRDWVGPVNILDSV